MSFQRREFLKLTGGIASGIVLSSFTGKLALNDDFFEKRRRLKNYGINLYSLRDVLPKDPKGVLRQVASFGYTQIESFESKKGIFWGMTNTEFKNLMDELGMNLVSSHIDINKEFEKKVSDAAFIGIEYLVCPSEGAIKTIDEYKQFAESLNANAAICKKNGIRFAYHNHNQSFTTINGEFPQEVLMQNTDPSLVDFEMDMYWVVTAGQDPVAWLKKYPNRFRLCHVKDRTKGSNAIADSCTLGRGSIDYPNILKEAKKQGMQFYIVEQEKYDNTNPIESAKDNAEYMKKIKI
ncbi:MAG: sugar phosphate isomerase/epimerase [Bacteroidota bacterium]|nr:sugar phosphate isomerase/epimerase [Bacteroidota bacterium]